MLPLIGVLSTATLAFISPAHSPSPANPPETWELRQIVPSDKAIILAQRLPKPTLRWDGRHFTGFTGCNDWQAGSGQFLRPVLTTQRPCSDTALSIEADFLRLLAEGGQFRRCGEQLTFTVLGLPRLVFWRVKQD